MKCVVRDFSSAKVVSEAESPRHIRCEHKSPIPVAEQCHVIKRAFCERSSDEGCRRRSSILQPRSKTKSTTEGSARIVARPSKRDCRTKRPRILEGDSPPKKVNHREERSFKTEDSSRKASDPRSKRRSIRGSLGLNCFSAFLTPDRGFTITAALSCKIQDNCTQQMCSFIR